MSESAFWDDLARDLEDPKFLRTFEDESAQIAATDRAVNEAADRAVDAATPQHVCDLQGFGHVDDVCPACEAARLAYELDKQHR